jgi:uroporphyrinogen decarboxylase
MIFDTWGGVLSPNAYHQFSLKYMQQIVTGLKQDPRTQQTPVILFTKQGGQWLEAIAQTGCQAVGIDWTVDIATARQRVGDKVALQGNLDPSILYARPEVVQSAVHVTLAAYGKGPGHIFNLGHGIYPDISLENVQALVEAVRAWNPNA